VAAVVTISEVNSTRSEMLTSTKVTHFWCKKVRFCTPKTMFRADSSDE